MTELTHPRLTLPFRGFALWLICALFIFPGLIGHDPWKGDDVISIDIVSHFVASSDWLVPRLAGEVYFDNPPLYYWVGAIFAKVFGAVLPLHDAARLASALALALMLLFLTASARRLHGEVAGHIAPLLGIGCVGLFIHSHDAQPLNALLAASGACYYGLILMRARALAGGATTGAAIGAGFLSCGLIAPLMLVPLALLLPAVSREWRTSRWLGGAALALAIAAALGAIWPYLLHSRDPALFALWWSRELADFQVAASWWRQFGIYLSLLSWFAWPAWPLALWSIWRTRRNPQQPGLALPLLALAIPLVILTTLLADRNLNALPLLPPLVLLAVPAAGTLRRGAANALDWFAMMTFTFFAGLVWVGWSAMVFGVPARLAARVMKLEPGFVAHFSWAAFAFALALCIAWLAMILRAPRSPFRGTTNWAAGITLLWCLLIALWLPLVDYGRSYRGVAESLARALPDKPKCIAGRDLGEPQRASFHYFAGITTIPEGRRSAARCEVLLVQSTERDDRRPGKGWRKVWEDHRPGDRVERYRLYRKE